MRKLLGITTAVSLILLGCGDGFKANPNIDQKVLGTSQTGGTTGETPGRDKVSPPQDLSGQLSQIRDANPGMINDCTGQPIANNFLLTVVRALQAQDSRWGFMVKSDNGKQIPRDLLAYRSSGELDGTHNFYIIEFVTAGCNNIPSDANFANPANGAVLNWNLANPDGYTDSGVWQFDP